MAVAAHAQLAQIIHASESVVHERYVSIGKILEIIDGAARKGVGINGQIFKARVKFHLVYLRVRKGVFRDYRHLSVYSEPFVLYARQDLAISFTLDVPDHGGELTVNLVKHSLIGIYIIAFVANVDAGGKCRRKRRQDRHEREKHENFLSHRFSSCLFYYT